MTKYRQKIIPLSIITGLSVWILDALLDAFIFSKGSFWNELIGDGIHELYFRSLFLLSFILFGVVISRLISKREQAEAALVASEYRHRMLFEKAGDAIFILDAEGENTGRIISANQAAADMHGYAIAELLKLRIKDIDAPHSAARAAAGLQRILRGEWVKEEVEHIKKDGTVFSVEINAGLLELGNHKYILAFERDITERKKIEETLKRSEDMYRSLMESTGDSIYVVDRDYIYMFVNKRHLERLGMTEDSFTGHSYGAIHSPEETEEFVQKVDEVFETGRAVQHEHLSLRDNRYFLRTLSPVCDADGSTIAVTVISKDINDLKQMEDRLRHLSVTDELTGLYNRRGFFVMVEQLIKAAKRHKKGVYMLYADLDNLKEINDNLGHREGDMALIDTANIFRTTYRESDIIARIGGDEFVVIPIANIGDNVDIITARLQDNINEHNAKNSRRYKLSISYGLSCYDPQSPSSVDELVQKAEKTMYEMKSTKKWRVLP